MQTPNKFALTAIAIVVSTFSANAQTNDEPGLFAEAKTTIAHDDNIYRVTDELAISDTYFRIAPELEAIGGLGKHRFRATYRGDYAKFSDASDADFNDHDLRGEIELKHTLRFSSHFEAGYQKDHETPGSINRIQLDLTEYNKFDQKFFAAGLAYGSEQSIGLLTIDFQRTDKDYTNNNFDYLDFIGDQVSGRFTFRLAPNTRIYAEALMSEFDYTRTLNFELDNTYKRYRAGISWDFTGKLTGDINLGYQDRDYDLATITDISGLAYDGEISWAINSFTKLVAAAKRESIDSTLEEASGFLRTTYSLTLGHEITERLKINANAGYVNDELVLNSVREDKRYAYQLGLDYELMRNISINTKYSFEERDSTLAIADYKANILSVGINVTMED